MFFLISYVIIALWNFRAGGGEESGKRDNEKRLMSIGDLYGGDLYGYFYLIKNIKCAYYKIPLSTY